jgi:hypothetical protein
MQTAVGNSATETVIARTTRTRFLPYALLIGLVFLVPHLVRIAILGSFREYTPYSVTSVSNVVTDESFLYGAQANTMLQQHRRADDTDSWEHRDSFFPYSVLPLAAEAVVAEGMAPGHPREGLKRAQILFHFVFPCLMGWLLMAFLHLAGPDRTGADRTGADRAGPYVAAPDLSGPYVFGKQPSGATVSVSAALALLVMVSAFSARTLTAGLLDALTSRGNDGIANTLQASRNPNPNVSFVLLLCAMHLLLRAFRTRSIPIFVAAGLVGSLLFYAYSFYAVSWSVACLLLASLSLWPVARIPRLFRCTLLATLLGALPYLLWMHASKVSGAYTARMLRLGMDYSRGISPAAAHITEFWSATLLALLAGWLLLWRTRSPSAQLDRMHAAVLITTALGFGGIAGLNMQLVTGFNIQAEFHYTHMVIQPAAALLASLLVATLLAPTGVRPWLGRVAFAVLLLACTASQVNAGIHSAIFHKLQPADKALFDWLESHTAPGDVVATTKLRLCLEMPLYTHNRLLATNGTRSAGTDQELLDRLLLANRLAGTSLPRLASRLRGDDPVPDGIHFAGYGSNLFERSPLLNLGTRGLTEAAVASALERFQQMNPTQELQRFRVNYLYTQKQETPVAPSGWTLEPVLRTEDGTLWHMAVQR